MSALAAERNCPIVLMHSRLNPKTMQARPFYIDVVTEVKNELKERADFFSNAGVQKENIILDPGFGFAKRFEDNITLLQNLSALRDLGYPVLIGSSRKAFIGKILGDKGPQERIYGSLATLAAGFDAGAKIFRVHDVGPSRDFLKAYSAIAGQPDK
jgi:dihydropteroate synthase